MHKVNDEVPSNVDLQSEDGDSAACSDSICEIYDSDGQKRILDFQNVNSNCIPATVCVDNSQDVIIGSVTQFNGPVTIYQGIGKVQNHDGKSLTAEETKLKDTDEALHQADNIEKKTCFSNHKIRIIGLLAALALLLLCVILYVVFSTATPGISNVSTYDENKKLNITTDGGHIFNKSIWGGLPIAKKLKPLNLPIKFVIICHTATPFYSTFKTCSIAIRNIQSYHMNDLEAGDIYYNFLVCGDGNVYIGRGWDYYNGGVKDSIQIAFVGNFILDELNDDMIAAAEKIISIGRKERKLSPGYILVAHNQTWATQSPGKNVYKVISQWPHFFNGSIVDGELVL